MKSVVLLLICVLTLPMFMGTFNIKSANCPQVTDWWPMFHHDLANTGHSTSTAPLTDKILWNYTTENAVWSSPAVADGVVFVGSHDGSVYALDAADGTQVWNYLTGDRVWSSPAVAGGVVFVGSYDRKVYALNASDGTQVWNYTTGNVVSSSPAVANGVVFVGSFDRRVYALNATDGTQLWYYFTGGTVFSSPAVANGVVFVGSTNRKVYAFGTLSYTTVGGELSQTSYVESFFVPASIMLAISGAISMLGFAHIKRSKQTQEKAHKT